MTTLHVIQRCLKPLAILLLTLPLTAFSAPSLLAHGAEPVAGLLSARFTGAVPLPYTSNS